MGPGNTQTKLFLLEAKFSLLENVKVFFNKVSHISMRYYVGSNVRWLLQNKKGIGVYCDKCGNIANGIKEGKVLWLTYRIPLCKKHLKETE